MSIKTVALMLAFMRQRMAVAGWKGGFGKVRSRPWAIRSCDFDVSDSAQELRSLVLLIRNFRATRS